MKNFFKQISKTFIVAIMILVTTITFVGCGKNNNQSKNATINASEITDTNHDQDKADNVSDDKDSDKDSQEEQKIELFGIYKYTRTLTFDDCDRTNEAEVIKYFQTRDFNGVYNAVKPLGFDKFINNHAVSDAETMFYFNGSAVSIILATNENYSLVADSEFLTNETFKKIEDNKDGTYTLYIAFITNEDVITPLIVKIPITKVANSENILVDDIFRFVDGSAYIDYDLTNRPTTETIIKTIANIFNIEYSETTLQEVENLLKEKVFGFNETLKRASLLKLTEENTICETTFTMVNSNNKFTLNGITYTLTAHNFTISENVEVVELSINILDNTNLVFKVSK